MKFNVVKLVCFVTVALAIESSPFGRSSIYSRLLLEKYLNNLLRDVELRGGSGDIATKRHAGPFIGNTSEFVRALDFEVEIDDTLSRNEEEKRNEDIEDPVPVVTHGRPVVYKYYSRSRARTRSDDSVPFILIGPNVDHWKGVGEALAWHGFNVFACERVNATLSIEQPGEGSSLVQAVLDALRWPKAILVGYGKEALVAIEAALILSPDRVAGLILAGDLSHAQKFVLNSNKISSLDDFLANYISCPSTIIWEGHVPLKDVPHGKESEELGPGPSRTIILGGGSAPHRRLPDQFAWVLSRFEEKISPNHYPVTEYSKTNGDQIPEETAPRSFSFVNLANLFQSEALAQVTSPGTLLVVGRILATSLFYLSAASVALHQNRKLKSLINIIRSPMQHFPVFGERLSKLLMTFFTLGGWIKRPSSQDSVNTNEEQEEDSNEITQIEIDTDPIIISEDNDKPMTTIEVPQYILNGLDSVIT